MEGSYKITAAPRQKLTKNQKTKGWQKRNIDFGMTLANYNPDSIRKTKREMEVNYKMIVGEVDEKELRNSLNPMNLKGVAFPGKVQNYPIELVKLNVLKGEEMSRTFNWYLRASNDHVFIDKDDKMKKDMDNLMVQIMENPEISETEATTKMAKLQKYYNYDYLDEREEMGTRLIEHIWNTQRVPSITSSGFYDVLAVSEENYAVDIEHGKPKVRRVRPIGLTAFGNASDPYIQNKDYIIEQEYVSVPKFIDLFRDKLTDKQIDELEDAARGAGVSSMSGTTYEGPVSITDEFNRMYGSQLVKLSETDFFKYGNAMTADGDILLTRVVWRSKMRIGKLYFLSEEGEEDWMYVPEEYKPVESLGQRVEWEWIDEWWHGYNYGVDRYISIERLPRIGMEEYNPGRVMPPYVGTIYTIGEKPFSLVDRIKPYKYLYNVTMMRAELANAKNKGVIGGLDIARIPDGYDPEVWMMYAELNGWALENSFNVGTEGAAKGQLIARLNNRAPSVYNFDNTAQVLANLEFARYLKNEINEITGITPQREGQTQARETLGGMQHGLQQSAFATEEYFAIHDNVKLDLIELILETGKYAFREEEFQLTFLDDGLVERVLFNGPLVAETDFGLYLTNNRNDTELFNFIRSYSMQILNADKAEFKDIFEIMRTRSIAAAGRKLEQAEAKKDNERKLEYEKTLESQQKIKEAEIAWEQKKFSQEMRIKMREIEGNLGVKLAELEEKRNSADDKKDTDQRKIESEIQKVKMKIEQEKRELEEQKREFDKEIAVKKKELSSKQKVIAST